MLSISRPEGVEVFVCTWIPHSSPPVRRAAVVANGGLVVGDAERLGVVANLVVGRDAAAIRFADLTFIVRHRSPPKVRSRFD